MKLNDMYKIIALIMFVVSAGIVNSLPASAQPDDVRSYTVTVPAHVVGCVPFELADDDDAVATATIDTARERWGAGALAAGVEKVGFLFVLDQDRKRKKGVYPIALSLCGTVETTVASSGSLSFVDLKAATGQIIYCASVKVDECMDKFKDKIAVSADALPDFPRYAFWTRKDPPSDSKDAVEGLIGSLIPVRARINGAASAQPDPDDQVPELRPLGSFSFVSCTSVPEGCPKAEGPGDPVGVLILIPSS